MRWIFLPSILFNIQFWKQIAPFQIIEVVFLIYRFIFHVIISLNLIKYYMHKHLPKKHHKIHKNSTLKNTKHTYQPPNKHTPLPHTSPTSQNSASQSHFSTSLIDMKEALLQQEKMFDEMLRCGGVSSNQDSEDSLAVFNLQKQQFLPLPDSFEQSYPIFTSSKELDNAVECQKVVSVEYEDYLTYIFV